jgi:large conductance mechanosensitive channel
MKSLRLTNLFKEFRDFINKGNLLAIAVGFVIGGAFSGLVKSLVEEVVMPIVAIPFGTPNFDKALILHINDAEIRFGAFLTVVVTFLSISFVLFLLLKAYNKATGTEAVAPPTPDVVLLTSIRDELKAIREQGPNQ